MTAEQSPRGGKGILASELLRFKIVDAQEKQGRVWDLAIDAAASDYPPVTALIFQAPRGTFRLAPIDSVRLDWQERRIVPDSDACRTPSAEDLDQLVLLRRDVLDALVLDLEHRQATRANDLWLRVADGRLLLAGADRSARGIFRRVLHGHLHHPRRGFLDWKHVEFLRGDPQAARRGRDYHRRVDRLPPSEIAHLADALPYLHAAELLTLMSDPPAADALEVMSPERQLQVFEELDEDQAIRLLALMAPDAAADLVGRLKPPTAERYLGLLAPNRSALVVDLLRYPEDSVGGLMTNDVVSVAASLTVVEARKYLRDRLKEPDFVSYIYVVDDQTQRLVGLVTLRDFVIAEDDAHLEDIMNHWLTALDPLAPASAAARRLVDSHYSALPVVSQDGRLLGAVTIDAAVTQVSPASWRAQAPHVFS